MREPNLFPEDKQKIWSKDEDDFICNPDNLLEGNLPKGRNVVGAQRRMYDIIAKEESLLKNLYMCKKILALLGNKNKTLKVKEN